MKFFFLEPPQEGEGHGRRDGPCGDPRDEGGGDDGALDQGRKAEDPREVHLASDCTVLRGHDHH